MASSPNGPIYAAPHIKLRAVRQYGHLRYFPANVQAVRLSLIMQMGKKTFSDEAVELLQKLGFEVVIDGA